MRLNARDDLDGGSSRSILFSPDVDVSDYRIMSSTEASELLAEYRSNPVEGHELDTIDGEELEVLGDKAIDVPAGERESVIDAEIIE